MRRRSPAVDQTPLPPGSADSTNSVAEPTSENRSSTVRRAGDGFTNGGSGQEMTLEQVKDLVRSILDGLGIRIDLSSLDGSPFQVSGNGWTVTKGDGKGDGKGEGEGNDGKGEGNDGKGGDGKSGDGKSGGKK